MEEAGSEQEWLCPECGETERLMRVEITDRQINEKRIKFQCAACGYTNVEIFQP